MKCGITGRTGAVIPFNVIEYSKYPDGESEIFDWIWSSHRYYKKMVDTINNINIYMENEYKCYDNNTIIIHGKQKDKIMPYYVSGVMYNFPEIDENIDMDNNIRRIKGEVFIVPVWYRIIDVVQFFYIFRTIIRTPFGICPLIEENSVTCEKFRGEFDNDLKDLKLKKVNIHELKRTKDFSTKIDLQYIPKNEYTHPIIFKNVENLELESFDDFMTKIEVIAKKYTLQAIGRRCRDFGVTIK